MTIQTPTIAKAACCSELYAESEAEAPIGQMTIFEFFGENISENETVELDKNEVLA